MKIPLGISDFGALRTQGFHYIDKTPFLAHLENLSPLYLLFHRPPGTGKSTFLSMLAYYYDIAQAEHFDTLFRGLWVHDHPTPGRGRYLVLSLDFSGLTAEGGIEGLRAAFTDVARAAVRRFVSTHREVAPEVIRFLRPIERFDTAADLLRMLFDVVAVCNRRMFVLIDGYDDFTWALALHDPQASYEVIHDRTGFVRSLYGVLKSGTACGGVERIFIAGVAPVCLSDFFSGFNIGCDISQDRVFGMLPGLTGAEVEAAVEAWISARPEPASGSAADDRRRLMELIEQSCGTYRFSPYSPDRTFNAGMVLRLLSEQDRAGDAVPETVAAGALADERLLRSVDVLTGADLGERRKLLEGILRDDGIEIHLSRRLGVSTYDRVTDFVSLLYYSGLLTLGSQPDTGLGPRLVIASEASRELLRRHLEALPREKRQAARSSARGRKRS